MVVPAGAVFFIRAWESVALGNLLICIMTIVLYYSFFWKTHNEGKNQMELTS
jgi:hypothetical protein